MRTKILETTSQILYLADLFLFLNFSFYFELYLESSKHKKFETRFVLWPFPAYYKPSMTQNPWTNKRRSVLMLWWISVEDFNAFLQVSYNENEGPDFPAWQMIWCPVLAGRCQLGEEVNGDTALSERLRWDLTWKGWMATSTPAHLQAE